MNCLWHATAGPVVTPQYLKEPPPSGSRVLTKRHACQCTDQKPLLCRRATSRPWKGRLVCKASGAISKPADLTQDVSDSLEKLLQQHAQRIFKTADNLPTAKRYLLAIAGAPGSGKTSSAYVTCHLLNQIPGGQGKIAAVVPMDGYHYTREQLDKMEDPKEAHARRGAHWTYDAEAFIQAIQSLKGSAEVKLPSFDHALGDPVEDDIEILQDHKIIIIEGNYVLLDEEPWSSIRDIVDETWFISCPIDTAMDRVLSRQLGNGSDLETARWRVSNNDRPNAELIEQSSRRATHIIASMPYNEESRL